MDIFGNGFQSCKVFQFIHAVTCCSDMVGINNDAVAFEAVAYGNQLAVFIIEIICVGVQFIGYGSSFEIYHIVTPVLYGVCITDNKQRRRSALIHLGRKSLAVGTGSRSDYLYRHTGLVGIKFCNFLEHLV